MNKISKTISNASKMICVMILYYSVSLSVVFADDTLINLSLDTTFNTLSNSISNSISSTISNPISNTTSNPNSFILTVPYRYISTSLSSSFLNSSNIQSDVQSDVQLDVQLDTQSNSFFFPPLGSSKHLLSPFRISTRVGFYFMALQVHMGLGYRFLYDFIEIGGSTSLLMVPAGRLVFSYFGGTYGKIYVWPKKIFCFLEYEWEIASWASTPPPTQKKNTSTGGMLAMQSIGLGYEFDEKHALTYFKLAVFSFHRDNKTTTFPIPLPTVGWVW